MLLHRAMRNDSLGGGREPLCKPSSTKLHPPPVQVSPSSDNCTVVWIMVSHLLDQKEVHIGKGTYIMLIQHSNSTQFMIMSYLTCKSKTSQSTKQVSTFHEGRGKKLWLVWGCEACTTHHQIWKHLMYSAVVCETVWQIGCSNPIQR